MTLYPAARALDSTDRTRSAKYGFVAALLARPSVMVLDVAREWAKALRR
jgi:hypothetical protein